MDAQVVSLLDAEFLASKDGGKHHMLNDLWQYNFYLNMNKHKSLCSIPCPTSTIWHTIFWWGLTITKDFQDSVFACESSLPLLILSWIASIDQCYVCQSPIKISTYNFPYVVSLLTIRFTYDLFHLFPFLFIETWE